MTWSEEDTIPVIRDRTELFLTEAGECIDALPGDVDSYGTEPSVFAERVASELETLRPTVSEGARKALGRMAETTIEASKQAPPAEALSVRVVVEVVESVVDSIGTAADSLDVMRATWK